jgi:hypothetical protein
MKIAALFASAFLLPLGILAAPADFVVDPHDGGLKHAEVACEIINVSTTARCRSGPDTKYDVVAEIKKGTVGAFTCVKQGECIKQDKLTNWYVMCACGLRLAVPRRPRGRILSSELNISATAAGTT